MDTNFNDTKTRQDRLLKRSTPKITINGKTLSGEEAKSYMAELEAEESEKTPEEIHAMNKEDAEVEDAIEEERLNRLQATDLILDPKDLN